jgi:thiosulfate/3-mercaptopyruvate sulfurtransferase
MGLVISAGSLHSIIGSADLIVVDTRPFSEYSVCHIPGAVNLDLMQFHWIDTSVEGIESFTEQSRRLLSSLGVSKRKTVIFYDNISGPASARGVWLLLYFSHTQVAMLDGGINSWKHNGYRTERKTNAFKPAKFEAIPDRKVLATVRDVKRAIASNSGIIIDSRSAAEYSGSHARAAKRGHIPSAINIDWTKNISNSNFKRHRSLERMYSNISKDRSIITYCQGGYRAANTFVVLRDLGFKHVKMYLGSWGEWGNNPQLPSTQT